MKKLEIGLIPISLGLLTLAVLLGIPSDMSTNNAMPLMYGIAIVEHYDSDENLISQQSIHNRITDQGEEFLLDQVFSGIGSNSGFSDQFQIGAVCIANGVDENDETLDDDGFNDAHDLTSPTVETEEDEFGATTIIEKPNCKTDRNLVTEDSENPGIVTIGPLTFTSGPELDETTNWNGESGLPITDMGVCLAADEDRRECGGRLFAVVGIPSELILGIGDTAQLSYRFNISSPDN